MRAGRVVRRGPAWYCSDNVLVFDAASGDFWVLTPQANALLGAILAQGSLSMSGLSSLVSGDLALPLADLESLVQDMVRSGLLSGPRLMGAGSNREHDALA